MILVPAGMSEAVERDWVSTMLARLERRDQRRPTGAVGEAALLERAHRLAARYLGGRTEPASVRWVTNQHRRWGSCTPSSRTIRLSDRLREMPDWVVDYVLLHELAHLLVQGHGSDFWNLLSGYPRTERARGYLEGVSDAARLACGVPGAGRACTDTEEGECP